MIVALFAYASLRPGEVAGFQWENYDGDMIRLTHNVWEGKIVTLKTKWAVAPIPVVAPLKSVLYEYRPTTAKVSWVLPGDTGKPVRLNALAERTMKSAFKRLGVEWKTWYGFRRGAATYLSEIGLSPDKVSAILRHSPSSKTAETHYIMTREKKNKAIGEVVDQLLAKRVSEQGAILREQLQKKPALVVN